MLAQWSVTVPSLLDAGLQYGIGSIMTLMKDVAVETVDQEQKKLSVIMKKIHLYILLIFAVIIGLLFINAKSEFDNLKENGLITTGRFTSRGTHGIKLRTGPDYVYFVNGTKYEGVKGGRYLCPLVSREKMKGLYTIDFPIIYDPKKPATSSIISDKNLASRFNVPFPDSLLNLSKKYIECDF